MSNKADAVKRARRLLDESEQLSKISAGPCLHCRWMHDPDPDAGLTGVRLAQRQCLHPIVSPVKLDIQSGEMVVSHAELINNARSSSGLCGVEGTLFEPRRSWQYTRFWIIAAILTPILILLIAIKVFP